ncbi:hypothetical protein ASE63_24410 [Bosea sp. Root381]|nr:hypothetical protein ASE63_24410 [Bosea sp. Root381]
MRQAGEQLDQILSHSRKVAATIADISAAAGEQANGIDEMSQAVAHLDEMTQQNAALSEQSAASAASLSSRIGQLNDLVAAFRTGQEQGAANTERGVGRLALLPHRPAQRPRRGIQDRTGAGRGELRAGPPAQARRGRLRADQSTGSQGTGSQAAGGPCPGARSRTAPTRPQGRQRPRQRCRMGRVLSAAVVPE